MKTAGMLLASRVSVVFVQSVRVAPGLLALESFRNERNGRRLIRCAHRQIAVQAADWHDRNGDQEDRSDNGRDTSTRGSAPTHPVVLHGVARMPPANV